MEVDPKWGRFPICPEMSRFVPVCPRLSLNKGEREKEREGRRERQGKKKTSTTSFPKNER